MQILHSKSSSRFRFAAKALRISDQKFIVLNKLNWIEKRITYVLSVGPNIFFISQFTVCFTFWHSVRTFLCHSYWYSYISIHGIRSIYFLCSISVILNSSVSQTRRYHPGKT